MPIGEAATPAAQMTVRDSIRSPPNATPSLVDRGDQRRGPHLDAERLEARPGLRRERLGEGQQDAVRPLEQDDASGPGVDVPEVAREDVAGDLGEGAGHLDSGRAAADDDEREPGPAPLGVVLALGRLEREQHAAADGRGVLDRLEPGRDRGPLVVAEIGVGRAGGDDQVVVADLAVGQHDAPGRRIDRDGLAQDDLHVLLVPEDPADRRRDVARVERGGRDLVEQRLEQVMVAAVDQGDIHRRPAKSPGRLEAREAAAEDHDARA